jgi:hypothetical protein
MLQVREGATMSKDSRFIKTSLIIIIVLLSLNLLARLPSLTRVAEAVSEKNFGGNSSAITCSADGKVVYASDGYAVFRSTNSGQAGTWEKVMD